MTPFDLETIKVTPASSVQLGHPLTISASLRLARRRTCLRPNECGSTTCRYHLAATSGHQPEEGNHLRGHDVSADPGDHYFDLQFNDGTGMQTFEEFETPPVTPIDLLNSTVDADLRLHHDGVHVLDRSTSAPIPPHRWTSRSTACPTPCRSSPARLPPAPCYSPALTLPIGSHSFAFSATDGTNYWGDPPAAAVYSGLVVSSAPNVVRHTTITAPAIDRAPEDADQG